MDQTPPQNEFQQPVLRPTIVPEPQTPQKSRFWGRLFTAFLLLAFLGSMALNVLLIGAIVVGQLGDSDEERVLEKYFSLNKHGTAKIAIISIEGIILDGEGFFKGQIDRAQKEIESGDLKAIVLRVNSPGGTICGSDYMLHHLRELVEKAGKKKTPIVVSMGGVAASGGYYVAMCVGDTPRSIFAEPSTWTGSIGVIIPHYNLAGLMEKLGVKEDDVASNPLKTMGSIAREMTPQEREIFKVLVNEGFTQFKDVIQSGRPTFRKDPAALDKLATGQVFTSKQALQNGLIDEIGFIEKAIDRAIELAKLDPKDVKVVKYKAEPRLANLLFGQSEARKPLDLSLLLDSTTPRGYYLCTWLPMLAGSAK
jgi:protease-4